MHKTGLQTWVDMYNKADKDRFEALLQRDRYKKALDEIEEICKKYNDSSYIEEVHIAYWTNQILQIIRKV